jgi:SagB-type dehydrogenase family enzyme
MSEQKTVAAIIRYHEQTKHHYNRYARSSGTMDWKNQPNPFRFYPQTPVFELPFLKQDPPTAHMGLYRREDRSTAPLDLQAIGAFMELSLGLSAWKSYGSNRWSLRMNPSSGNLHPTEAYVVLPRLGKLDAGVYHYNSLLHALEQRRRVPETLWASVIDHLGCRGFLIGLSSIFWRESWKYGERAFRYCNHDVGHALAALAFAAALQGWKVTYLNALSDTDIEHVLGFDRTRWHPLEGEHPDLLGFVHTERQKDIPRNLPDDLLAAFSNLAVVGGPNRLSAEGVNWEIIYRVADDTRKPRTAGQTIDQGARAHLLSSPVDLTAADILRKRRSATAFDPDADIEAAQLFSILDKTLPRNGPPFDVQLGEPCVHLLLFIHNVTNLPRGLYFFLRTDMDRQAVQAVSRKNFLWQPVDNGLPLFLLETGDFRHEAIQISCHQEIAGFSAFSLGMLAKFEPTIRQNPYRYRHLFWEAGMIGQVLYLEAEAQGLRGTGIGCYFDDPVHQLFGLEDNTWQSLYHFTVGHPVDDPRLSTLPAYHHLERA